MNVAERKRKSREALKGNSEKWQEFLAKEKIREAKRRDKNREKRSHDEEARILWREKQRLRKMKLREKKKQLVNPLTATHHLPSSLGGYKCVGTLRKAVIKTQKSLPTCPMKKQAVILELLNEIPKSAIDDYLKKTKFIISEKEEMEAQRFYERDDISRAAPERQDTISIKSHETGTTEENTFAAIKTEIDVYSESEETTS